MRMKCGGKKKVYFLWGIGRGITDEKTLEGGWIKQVRNVLLRKSEPLLQD